MNETNQIIDDIEFAELFKLFDEQDHAFVQKNKSEGFWNYITTHKNPKIQAWCKKRLERIVDNVLLENTVRYNNEKNLKKITDVSFDE